MSRMLLRPFFGIPDLPKGADFTGADCWGLARLAYRDLRGIDLPDYAGDYLDDRAEAEISAIIHRETSKFWTKVDAPMFLDLALFRIGPYDSHIGIYAEPGWMLHMVLDDVSKFARYDRLPWCGNLAGFYRFGR